MAISHQNGVIDSCDYEMLCFESIPWRWGRSARIQMAGRCLAVQATTVAHSIHGPPRPTWNLSPACK